mgnify:FL=1
MSTYTNDKLQIIADTITTAMDKKGVEWFKPFTNKSAFTRYNMPSNVVSGANYSGFNSFWLQMVNSAAGYDSVQWATFKQIQSLGGRVLKGEKATPVCYYGTHTKKVEIDGQEVTDAYRFLKFYNVFNLSQTNLNSLVQDEQLLKDNVEPTKPLIERINSVDNFVSNLNADIRHEQAGKCCYYPTKDYINMSPLDSWSAGDNYESKEEAYYAVLLHELAHWTGHEKRLNREKGNPFGSEGYAFEELIAEYSSAFLCGILNISKVPSDNHAAYISNWSRAIKKDPKKLLKAIAAAQKVVNFMQDKQAIKQPNKVQEAA